MFEFIGNIKKAFAFSKAIKNAKIEIAKNSEIVDKIIAEIEKIITALNNLKKLVPQIADFIESIIDIFKGIIR